MNKQETVRDALLAHRKELMKAKTKFWHFLSPGGRPASQRVTNKFFLACIVNYRQPAYQAWSGAQELVRRWANPEDLWERIASFSEGAWMAKHRAYNLHRYAQGHRRVWSIARLVSEHYDGDVRKIWTGVDVATARQRLHDIHTGQQTTEMVLGALRDTEQIRGSSDVKADTHVRRVIGRIMLGRTASEAEASDLTRAIHRADPWALDRPLYCLGKDTSSGSSHDGCCRAGKPSCAMCIPAIVKVCTYAREHGVRATDALLRPQP